VRRTSAAAAVTLALLGSSLTTTSAGTPAAAAAPPAPAAQATTGGFDPVTFRSPRSDSRPAIYWYWGGVITPEIVDLQMAEMRDKGIESFVLFPFNGDDMRPLFASEEWFDLVGHTLEEARRTGMKVWLFNDNNFPSGRGANLVVNGGTLGDRTIPARPDLRLKGLWRSTSVVAGGTSIPLDRSSGVSTEGGRLAVDAQVHAGGAPLATGAAWTDYTVEATDVRVTGTRASILVRASQDGRSGYLVELRSKGELAVVRLDDGVRTQLSAGTAVPGFTFQRPRRISVTVAGGTITPSLDGRAQPGVTDAAYATGTVAPYAEGTDRVLMGDLKVSAPDARVLWSSDFETPDALGDFVPTLELGQEPVAAVARPAGSHAGTDLVELTPRLGLDGRPTWTAPPGRWQVDLFGSMTLIDDTRGYTRGYLDLLDENATDAFMNTIPAEYVRRWPWAMGTVVPGFWDDEPYIAAADPHPFKRQPWSPELAAELGALGATPGKAYVASYDALGREGERLRGQYWGAVNNRFSQAYYQRQADWMAAHGLQLISNPLWDETGPSRRMGNTGDLTKDNQWAQVPGTDMITGDYELGEQTSLVRNAASNAHQAGHSRVVLETFGNSGWQVAPDYMHATLGALAVRGATMPFLHAMWTDEVRVIFAPPFGPRSTFWEEMGPLDDWIGRVMEISRGTDAARTALVQVQDAAQQLHGLEEEPEDDDEASGVDHDFAEAGFDLERSQVDFDLVHDGALSGDTAIRHHAEVRGGRLLVGAASYDAAVLPETPVLDVDAARTLLDLVRSGGSLVAVGAPPAHETDGRDGELARVLGELGLDRAGSHRVGAGQVTRVSTVERAGEAAAGLGAAALRTSGDTPALRVARRTQGGDLAYLLNNESDEPVRTTLTFDHSGTPQLWDPATGSTAAAPAWSGTGSTTQVPVELDPYETLAVVFPAGAPAGAHLTGVPSAALEPVTTTRGGDTLAARVLADRPGTWSLEGVEGRDTFRGRVQVSDPLEPVALGGSWGFRLDRAGEVEVQRPLGTWNDVAPKFSGTAVYTRTVELAPEDLAGRRIRLDLGEVHDLAEVTVNGTTLPVAYWAPYVVDVTDALRPGVNTIEVAVTNTLANERNQNRPSGLAGPVSLVPVADVTATLAREGGEPAPAPIATTVRVKAPGTLRAGRPGHAVVRVTAASGKPQGRLVVRYAGRRLKATRTRGDGAKVFALSARTPGRYRLVAVFQPADGYAGDRVVRVVKVRR
jgi:hypothetical protein